MNDSILLATNANNPQVVGQYNFEATPEDKAKQLPEPVGYRILCAVPDIDKEFDGGLVKADVTINNEEAMTTVLFVVKLGPDCYRDVTRFPNGPWCKEGDFVLIRPYTGSRLVIHGREFRIINDDSIEGVVQDPRGITRK
jgi:co-chaperonin GroES (HSP10)